MYKCCDYIISRSCSLLISVTDNYLHGIKLLAFIVFKHNIQRNKIFCNKYVNVIDPEVDIYILILY